jgi:hypothetical protein
MSQHETVPVPRWAADLLAALGVTVRDALLGPPDDIRAALDAVVVAAREPIPWGPLRPLIDNLRDESGTQPIHATAQLDQMRGYVTERLRQLDVEVRDPRVLYEALCVVALVHECAVNAAENGALNDDEASAVRACARIIGAALGPLAPDEARS